MKKALDIIKELGFLTVIASVIVVAVPVCFARLVWEASEDIGTWFDGAGSEALMRLRGRIDK